jgi:lipoprotein LpqH
MNREILIAVGGAAIIIAGLSGCGSDKSETSGETSSAAAAEGKSTVTIDGADQEIQGTVVCSDMGGNTNIAIGDATAGIGAVVTTGDEPSLVSVGLGNVNGATLGYQTGVGANDGKVEKDDKTYKISGTATGADMSNPMQPVNKPFEIEVTCP